MSDENGKAGGGATPRKGQGPTGVLINRLKGTQEYRLTHYLDTHRDRLAKSNGYDPIAKEAAEKLEFPVTGDNVKRCWRTCLGLPAIKTVGTSRSVKYRKVEKLVEEMADVKARLETAEANVLIALRRITTLETELGVKKV